MAALATCALRFWRVTLGSSFTQFHAELVLWVPQTVLVNSGPLPSHGSCFEKHPSDAVMHKAPPTSQLFSPPSYFDWRNNADCLPPSGTDWVGGGVMKGQSAHNPPPVPHTITLLMFCKNLHWLCLNVFCLPSLWSLSEERGKSRGEQAKLQHREDTMADLWGLR